MSKKNKLVLSCNENQSASVGSYTGVSANANEMRPFLNEEGQPCIIANGEAVEIQANANVTLPYQAWLDIDERVIAASEDRLVGIGDLINMGLTHDLGGLGATVSQWDKMSSLTPANVSMDGETQGEKDRVTFGQDSVPIPIIHKDFTISQRARLASERTGESLDTTSAFVASQKVSEKSEDMLFGSVSVTVGSASISSYTNFANRNTHTISTAWDLVTDNEDIVDDVIAMMDLARADGYYGPYKLYIPSEYEGVMDKSFKAASGNKDTVRDRLMQIAMLNGIGVADRLADNNVVLVQMTPDVVDLAVGQTLAAVEWTNNAGFTGNHKVFAAWAPRLKSDFDGNCGIVHGSV
jgi:uncharacterized linocin/CFP29 family protein